MFENITKIDMAIMTLYSRDYSASLSSSLFLSLKYKENARAGIRTRIVGLEGRNTSHCTTRANEKN